MEHLITLNIEKHSENGEERWQTLGLINNVVMLLVAHSIVEENNNEIIRIISARKATKHERCHYEQSN